jgi:hypothetical protein
MKEHLERSMLIFAIPAAGLDIPKVNSLRNKMPESTTVSVCKNNLIELACKDTDWDHLGEVRYSLPPQKTHSHAHAHAHTPRAHMHSHAHPQPPWSPVILTPFFLSPPPLLTRNDNGARIVPVTMMTTMVVTVAAVVVVMVVMMVVHCASLGVGVTLRRAIAIAFAFATATACRI